MARGELMSRDQASTLQKQLNSAMSVFCESVRQIIQNHIGIVAGPRNAVRMRDDFSLTAQQKRVLALVLDGLQNKQIADRIGVSTQTVKFHIRNILAKHAVNSRHDLQKFY